MGLKTKVRYILVRCVHIITWKPPIIIFQISQTGPHYSADITPMTLIIILAVTISVFASQHFILEINLDEMAPNVP